MPFDNGSITFTIFELNGELPEDVVSSFAAEHAGTLDSVSTDPDAEPQIGWVTGRHLLDNQIEEDSVYRGGFLTLALRKAQRKMPSSLLNAICRREEDIYMRANEVEFVSSKAKKEIKEEAIARHLPKMPPSLSGIQMVVDTRENMLYLGAASMAQIDLFTEYFYKATKVEPLQLTPALLLAKHFETTESHFPMVEFSSVVGGEPVIGRDFLTWLWYFNENGGRVSTAENGDFEILVEGPFTFAFASEANGSEEIAIKKGNNPERSAEAKAALAVGKKLKKAKFSLVRGEEIWSGVFDADKFSFSSVKLPEGEAMAPEERFIERMELLAVFKSGMEALFVEFAKSMLAPEVGQTMERLKAWADSRDAI